jgi:pimeloyl-ACP methyl ester carboxylesterase
MSNQIQKSSSSKKWHTILKLSLAVGLVFILALGALVYLRPIAVMTTVQRGLLRLGGIESRFAQAGPYRIHYLVGGDGPPLLLLHGHPSRALEWGPILRPLTSHHRVIAIDFLGYGESDAPDVDYSIATQAGVVVGLLDALGLNQTDVLGFSMGGWVALKLAAEHPERVRRLVLVDSGGLKFQTMLTPDSFVPRTLAEFREFEALHSDRRLPDFVARDLVRLQHERAWALRRVGQSLLSFRDALDGRLENVRMPVLLVWGTADRLIPFEVARRFERELPHAKLVALEGCGHLVLWDCGDRAVPEVLAFLR